MEESSFANMDSWTKGPEQGDVRLISSLPLNAKTRLEVDFGEKDTSLSETISKLMAFNNNSNNNMIHHHLTLSTCDDTTTPTPSEEVLAPFLDQLKTRHQFKSVLFFGSLVLGHPVDNRILQAIAANPAITEVRASNVEVTVKTMVSLFRSSLHKLKLDGFALIVEEDSTAATATASAEQQRQRITTELLAAARQNTNLRVLSVGEIISSGGGGGFDSMSPLFDGSIASLQCLTLTEIRFTRERLRPIERAIIAHASGGGGKSALTEIKFEMCHFNAESTQILHTLCHQLPSQVTLHLDTNTFEKGPLVLASILRPDGMSSSSSPPRPLRGALICTEDLTCDNDFEFGVFLATGLMSKKLESIVLRWLSAKQLSQVTAFIADIKCKNIELDVATNDATLALKEHFMTAFRQNHHVVQVTIINPNSRFFNEEEKAAVQAIAVRNQNQQQQHHSHCQTPAAMMVLDDDDMFETDDTTRRLVAAVLTAVASSNGHVQETLLCAWDDFSLGVVLAVAMLTKETLDGVSFVDGSLSAFQFEQFTACIPLLNCKKIAFRLDNDENNIMKDDFVAAIQQNHTIVDVTGIIDCNFFSNDQIACLVETSKRNTASLAIRTNRGGESDDGRE